LTKINVFSLEELFSLFSDLHPRFLYTDLSNQKANYKTDLLQKKKS